jgi:CheY-like chemotaxis protein
MALAWVSEDGGDGEGGQAPPADVARSQMPNDEAARSGEVAAPRPLTVLVTDDNAALRMTVSEILQAEGYQTVEAEDGLAALRLLQEQVFDVLIVDLAMPRADGVALLRQIEVTPPVVIICSAFAYYSLEEVRDEVGAKVFRYLEKPVPAEHLIATVHEAVAELDR